MKKSLLVALVGFVLFAMTSCGDSTKANQESKEFAAAKAYIEKYDKAFQNAQSCDELETIMEQMEEEAAGIDSDNFAEDERITEAEEDALKDLVLGWLETIQKKVNELGCDEEEVEEEVVVVDEE
jgi:hypothetical protein